MTLHHRRFYLRKIKENLFSVIARSTLMLYLCERFFSFLFVAMTYDIFRLLCIPHAKYVFIFVVISNFCGKVKKKYSGKKKLFSAPTPGPQIISAPPAPQHYLLFYSPFCVFRLYDTKWESVLWIQIHWIWARILKFDPIWIRIRPFSHSTGNVVNFEKRDFFTFFSEKHI